MEDVLRRHFDLAANEVSAEEPVCYDRRDLRRALTPDVFVALGVPSRIRERYLPWKKEKPPDWALEVASSSTAERDRTDKLAVYFAPKVREVFLFDPTAEFHGEVLAGYRWEPQGYQAIEPEGERVASEALGLLLEPEPYRENKVLYYRLRFVDPKTGGRLPTTEEILKSKDQALDQKDQALAERDRLIQELRRKLGEV